MRRAPLRAQSTKREAERSTKRGAERDNHRTWLEREKQREKERAPALELQKTRLKLSAE